METLSVESQENSHRDRIKIREEIFAPPAMSPPESAWGGKGREAIDEGTIRSAMHTMAEVLGNDASPISKILREHANKISGGIEPSPNLLMGNMVEDVRTNPDLRIEIARATLESIEEHISLFPDRIRRNTEKLPGLTGYPERVTSREYVALLCLSMLDGTFQNDRVPKSDNIQYDQEYGSVESGQHRASAEMLLFGRLDLDN
ncbi:hypothetical protein DYH10_03995 [Candidatus Saccharibacteria bacterium CPR2]|nr:hypothetical protein [Candidatus Saccharibacteria bacterium CPR2]